MPKYSIILIEPKYPGNIGSVARVMKNFGFSDLFLIKPPRITKDARKYASHAQDVLEGVKKVRNFSELIDKEKFDFLIATSAIFGTYKNTLRTPVYPKDIASSLNLKNGKIGLVFGREDSGLLNEEIIKCDMIVTIPTSRTYPTLNIAQSVGIILYEISKLNFEGKKLKKKFRKPDLKEKEILLSMFDSLVDTVQSYDARKRLAKKTFKTLIGRAFISGGEAGTLTGIFRRAKDRINGID